MKQFKEKNDIKISIFLFTILCILFITGIFFYQTFASFQVIKNQDYINGTIEDPGDIYFAFYKDDVIQKEMPKRSEGYVLDEEKSYCGITGKNDSNIKVSISDDETIQVSGVTTSRTKCNLYFEPITKRMFREVNDNTTDHMWGYKDTATKIFFQNKIEEIPNEIAHFDESVNGDGSLISRIVPNEENPETYTIYIQANGKIKANYISRFLFYQFTKVTDIEGMEFFDTRYSTNLYGLFKQMRSLKSIDVSHFNTHNVTFLNDIFNGCSQLEIIIGLNNWDTSSATNMDSIFASTKLSVIDVSNWNTKNVKNLDWTFFHCENLIEIKGIEKWDTSQMISMENLFADSISLTSLNLGSWDTRNVTSMFRMFLNTPSLQKIYYGPYFIHKEDANITQMFNKSKANKPTDPSWSWN